MSENKKSNEGLEKKFIEEIENMVEKGRKERGKRIVKKEKGEIEKKKEGNRKEMKL